MDDEQFSVSIVAKSLGERRRNSSTGASLLGKGHRAAQHCQTEKECHHPDRHDALHDDLGLGAFLMRVHKSDQPAGAEGTALRQGKRHEWKKASRAVAPTVGCIALLAWSSLKSPQIPGYHPPSNERHKAAD